MPIKSSNPWVICLSAGLFFFYVFLQMNVFDVINLELRQAFHLNAEQLSWMSSTFVWASILLFIPAGILIDKFPTRQIILVAMLLCVIGTLGFALTQSYFLACLFHSFSGIANAFCFLSCFILVCRFFPPQQQAFVTGCLVTMAFCGGMVAHTPFVYLNDCLGWRKTMLIDACMGILILSWLYLSIQNQTQPEPTPNPSGSWATGLKQILANKQNWLAGLYIACLNLPIMVFCALWGASYVEKVHHLTHIEASYMMSLILIGSMLGGPLFGFFSDKLGRRKPIMLIGSLTTFLIMLPCILYSELDFAIVAGLFFVLGLLSSSQIVGYPLIAESNPNQTTGIATAFASIVITGGGGIGQLLFGALLQHHAGTMTQYFSSVDFQYAMILLPLAAIIACIAVLGMQETHCTKIPLS